MAKLLELELLMAQLPTELLHTKNQEPKARPKSLTFAGQQLEACVKHLQAT